MPPCTGILVQWKPGSVWNSYPYQLHAERGMPWIPIGFEGDRHLCLQSTKCSIILSDPKELNRRSCRQCDAICNSASYQDFEARAMDAAEHTPWRYLTPLQMQKLAAKLVARNHTLELNVLNMQRKMWTMHKRLTNYERMIMLLSKNDVVGLRRLLAVQLNNGASPQVILAQLERAITGVYAPRGGWTNREYDIAFIAKALGGPRLLFALNHALGLPSTSTVQGRRIRRLLTSRKKPDTAEIQDNITSILGPGGRKPPTLVNGRRLGQQLMIDGIALEEVCRYDSSRNCIIGLCREHSDAMKLTLDSVEVVERIQRALFEEESCHLGKDGTVVAIAPVADKEDYSPVCIVLSPSCKKETGEELATWVARVLDAYRDHPCGEEVHGPIWTLATDGEASFRSARFALCMCEDLDRDCSLGRKLYALKGLNCQTGPRTILATCDPKHVIKRFASMIRSPTFIQVFDTTITAAHIRHYLATVPGMSEQTVTDLMDPADKQNVPKAVSLIRALKRVADSPAPISSTPTNLKRRRAIGFLADVLNSFLLQGHSMPTLRQLLRTSYLQLRGCKTLTKAFRIT